MRRTEVRPICEPASDLRFADAGAMQFPDLGSVHGRCCRPAQPFAVLPSVGQASASSLPQDLPFELGENGQQPRHRSTGRRSQVQRLGQRHETHTEMLQFLKGCQQIRYRPAPAVQPPYQHDVDLAAAGGLQQFLTSFSLGRTGADLTDVARQCVQPRRAAYSRMARLCMDSVC